MSGDSPTGFRAAVRSGYDRWAAVYDHDGNPLQALEEPELRRLAGDPRGLDCLDLGCGTGRHALWLAEQGGRVTAVDFSAQMLDQARAKPGAAAVRWLCHDLATPLPLPDGGFDLAVSGLVLEHVEDLAAFFRELRRLLRPGGRAVLSAMHPRMFEKGAWARFTDPATGQVLAPGSRPHSLEDFLQASTGAGFALEEMVERAPVAAFAERWPRAGRYVGWPMLVVLSLRADTQG